MTSTRGHTESVWLEHAIAAVVVATLLITFWRPDRPASAMANPNSVRIAQLAALVGEPFPRVDEIEQSLRSIGRFPPSQTTSRRLAEALAACGMARLSEPERIELARQLYAITTGGDVPPQQLALALTEIQQTAIRARCSPVDVTAVVDAARSAARTDPKPRRDWW